MYRQCSCLYRYPAYILNMGTYSDPYTSMGATLIYLYMYITNHIHIVSHLNCHIQCTINDYLFHK